MDNNLRMVHKFKNFKGKIDFKKEELKPGKAIKNGLFLKIAHLKTKKEEEIINEIIFLKKIGKIGYRTIQKPMLLTKTDNLIIGGLNYINAKDLSIFIKECNNLRVLKSTIESTLKEIKKLNSLGVIHNDMHLANILIFKGYPKIIDFGLARFNEGVEASDLISFMWDLSNVLKNKKKGEELFDYSEKQVKKIFPDFYEEYENKKVYGLY